MIEKINNRVIGSSLSLLQAMKKMDEENIKTLFVFENDKFEGILTIGDIQRAIIKGIKLSNPINQILDKNKIYASHAETKEQVADKMRLMRAEVMPILDEEGNLKDVWFWGDLFNKSEESTREPIDLPVIIMAGGKGTRLKPLTNVLPKPLIPLGDKTILEKIMNQFESIGCHRFYMSVNYKSDMIRFYLDQLEHSYDVDFFEETKPLGTIGSVSLLNGKINTPFFVSNCDIIIEQDFRDVYDYHKDNKNELTIVTADKSLKIPYGVVETGQDGLLTGILEKPESTYLINTGLYILNPNLIEEIPEGEFFHITDLIDKIMARGGRVGSFPVSDSALRDMGEWPEYLKMINVL